MRIFPDNEMLQYSGRIDFDDSLAPVFVYPCSWIKIKFTGRSCSVIVENHRQYWDSYLGYIIDGVQGKVEIAQSGTVSLNIPVDNGNSEHELMVFKRQDSCHIFRFLGFELEDGATLKRLEPKPDRRIEVYGDSVSAGEVAEAVEYAGKPDPVHNGEYSNGWYSYGWITARKLNAEIHDIAQGGIALLDGTGWFSPPDYIGMETVYDKITYNPALSGQKQWDFKKYTPHVVVVAIGQNDSHPYDYMAKEPAGEAAAKWKKHYKAFVNRLREIYPDTVIILSTTILDHSVNWDRAVDEVCREINDSRVYHFLYSNNGAGTPGHIRIQEAEKMADELSAFIASLGDDIWNN